ncbi:uncharacterized protein [Dermacentor albipictus]|uniref:uncharacterized protein n=1 Tax=Dermacentor albipictus TaxID=60249 RepID=UPI0038FD0285
MDDVAPIPADRDDTINTSLVIAPEFRLPSFWQKNIYVWFMQIEAHFQPRHITSHKANCLHVVAALPFDIAYAIDDLPTVTPSATAYNELKRAVLQRLEPSQQSRLQQLLSKELREQRPSQLMHRLRQLLGEHSENESQLPVLRELSLQHLPQSTRIALADSDEMSLARLDALADRICDCSSSAQLLITTARRTYTLAEAAVLVPPSFSRTRKSLHPTPFEAAKCTAQSATAAREIGSRASRLFFVADRITGWRLLVDTGAELSMVPAMATDNQRGQSQPTLHEVNNTAVPTYGLRSTTLYTSGPCACSDGCL